MKRIHFFALKDDIVPLLEAVEAAGPLKYVRTGNQLSADFDTFPHGADIPNLGKADENASTACKTFVVTRAELSLNIRAINSASGIRRYCMDQLVNPDTVVFTPAGIWSEDVVLSGHVTTVSDSDIAQGLMKRFSSAIRAQFTKVQAFWVGQKARALLDAGKRLTDAVQSPRIYDLATDPPEKSVEED